MSYLLDTNAWSAFLKERPRLSERVARAGVSNLLLSAVTWFELQYGVELAPPTKRRRLEEKLRLLSTEVGVVPYDRSAAQETARVRAQLRVRGTPVGPYDLQLAGHALALGAILVTNNTREVLRVPGLTVEDWT